MDERYYMLVGLGLLLAVLVVYFLITLVRYLSALKRARSVQDVSPTNGEDKYLGPQAESAEDLFAVPAATSVQTRVAESAEPRVYDFDIPEVHASAPTKVSDETPVVEVPAPEPEPAPEISITFEPEPELVPEPAPQPEPTPEPEHAPTPTTLPGYSLADELDRLMSAAELSTPLLTPAEHEAVVAPAAPPSAEEPTFGIHADPMFPPPSVGQVLSVASTIPAPVPEPEPAPAPAPAPAPEPEPEPAPAPAPAPEPEPAPAPAASRPGDIPEYRLVSPVELHFTLGEGRIGVKAGTRSFAEFQRLAGILLQDLQSARGR